MPMVSITIENAGWPRMGRITARSASTPNAAIAAMAAGTASQNGKPSIVIATSPPNAPSIMSSPCAKLTVSVAL